MPTLRILGSLTTRPFASDDLQIPCLFVGICRILQLICVSPLWIHNYLLRFQQGGAQQLPYWCEDDFYASTGDARLNIENGIVLPEESTTPDRTNNTLVGTLLLKTYLFASAAFLMADMALLAAIWSASGVGTPTEYMGRDRFLRPLIRIKAIVMYVLVTGIVLLGLFLVAVNRRENYGCPTPFVPGTGFEGTPYYKMFCVMLVSQSLEVIFIPTVVLAKLSVWFRRHSMDRLEHHTGISRGRSLDVCMTGCFKACGLLCCKPTDMASTGELRDAAEAVLDFFRDRTKITWTDLYICIRMLAQIQRERRLERIKHALTASALHVTTPDTLSTDPDHPSFNARTLLTGELNAVEEDEETKLADEPVQIRSNKTGFVTVLLRNDHGDKMNYERVIRKLLLPGNQDEISLIRRSIRYARHSNAVYADLLHLCNGYTKLGIDVFQTKDAGQAVENILDSFLDHRINLDSIGIKETILAYSNFVNGINKTPYSISIDKEHQEVILAIRGTASLEDAVIDLQLIPLDLGSLGVRCGFDGDGEKCHKGVLTRCIWIYDDLKEHGVLQDLLLGENARLAGYSLIITGHSLGAGCAAVLSCMIRRQFPGLQCFAFCPPGGLISEGLSEYCKPFVTSFVNGADIIPRMSLSNCEMLRDEALETLARIRVAKFQVYRCLRVPHSDNHVSAINSCLLYPRDETPRDTEFYKELEDFRDRQRARKEERQETPLFLPGRIVQIIRTKKGPEGERKCVYTPQWAERTDFNEIMLSNQLVEDHSMASVIPNLVSVLDNLTNPARPVMEHDEVLADMPDTTTNEKNPVLNVDRDFICCSRPHGNRSLLGALLASVACFLCMTSNSHCVFADRSTEWFVQGLDDDRLPPSFYGTGVATGLYNYEKKVYDGVGDPSDVDSYVGSGTCQPFPLWFEVDPYLRRSRAFGTLAVITGGTAMLILWLSTCIFVPKKPWVCHSVLVLLTLVFELLVFGFFFQSNVCTSFDFEDENGLEYEVVSECEISWGANVAKACIAIWLTILILTAKYPKPRL